METHSPDAPFSETAGSWPLNQMAEDQTGQQTPEKRTRFGWTRPTGPRPRKFGAPLEGRGHKIQV
eukprot:6104632-Pyramimonas_sp.AAC.1